MITPLCNHSYYTKMENEETGYLETNVFPVLLIGMENLLKVATATERRKLFNPLDYLVEYLYKNNPVHDNRDDVEFPDIPFVKEEWLKRPRSILPLSATLTEEEATIKLQAAFRGYKVRCRKDVQVFLQWQQNYHKEIEATKIIQRHWRLYLASK